MDGEADVSRRHCTGWEGRRCARGWRGRYKRQTDRGIVALCVCASVCAFARSERGIRRPREGGRDGGGCVVYRYSHGRVFAAIFGPFPFAARGAFTVHTSYPNPAVHLLVTPSFDRRHPRVMDTQGVGDYANEAARPFWRIASRWARRVAKLVCRFLFEPITL